MKIIESREFSASPAELWVIIGDPAAMPAWNERCQSCDSIQGSGLGARFRARFSMNNKVGEAQGEIVEWEEQKRITYRYGFENDDQGIGTIEESYSLHPKSDGRTKVKHVVDFRRSNLPFWVKLLITFIGRFGRSVGSEPLSGIDELLR